METGYKKTKPVLISPQLQVHELIVRPTTSQQVLDQLLMTTETGIIPKGQEECLYFEKKKGLLGKLYLQRSTVPFVSHIEVHISLFNKVSDGKTENSDVMNRT